MTKSVYNLGGLIRFRDNPDRSWRRFGKTEPYFGVLTAPRFRKENLNETSLTEFFASGENHVTNILEIVRSTIAANLPMNTAVDFGCGVGRIVLPLSRRFSHVTGIDISEDYIAEARRNCQKYGVTNADFCETAEQLAAEGRRYDFAHSCIVFNHIPWPRGREIIAELFELLNPGGGMAIQILHRHKRGTLGRIGRWARRNITALNWMANILQKRPIFEPLMQGNAYPLDELLPYIAELGAERIHVRPEPTTAGQSFAFIFCRKPQVGPVLDR